MMKVNTTRQSYFAKRETHTKEGFIKAINKVVKAKKPDEKRSDKGMSGKGA